LLDLLVEVVNFVLIGTVVSFFLLEDVLLYKFAVVLT